MDDNELQNKIDARIKKLFPEMLRAIPFTNRTLTDTPTDALATVNRKYVTNNGTVANRPVSSVATIGQPYLATDTGIPMTKVAGGWANGNGSIVALNN